MSASEDEFVTTREGLIPAGQKWCDVAAEAVRAGARGNIAAGSVCLMVLAPVGIAGVTNTAAFSGGCDAESDDALRQAFAQACLDMVHEFTNVLGLLYNKKEEESLDEKVEAMIQARQDARKAKNFAEADRIRDELKAMGITLMDTPQGVKWSKS